MNTSTKHQIYRAKVRLVHSMAQSRTASGADWLVHQSVDGHHVYGTNGMRFTDDPETGSEVQRRVGIFDDHRTVDLTLLLHGMAENILTLLELGMDSDESSPTEISALLLAQTINRTPDFPERKPND